MSELGDRLKEYKEWEKAVVFDGNATVLASTFQTDTQELKEFLQAWDNRDDTVGKGFILQGHHFDVHRWYDNLVYGRRGDTERGEGICLMRKKNKDDQYVYAIITYVFPTISARAIPQLVEFGEKYCRLALVQHYQSCETTMEGYRHEGEIQLTADAVQEIIGLPPGDVENQKIHRRARSISVYHDHIMPTVSDGPAIDAMHMFKEGMLTRNHQVARHLPEYPFNRTRLTDNQLGLVFDNFVFPLRKTARRSSSFATQDFTILFKDITSVKIQPHLGNVFSLQLDKNSSLSKLYNTEQLLIEVEHRDELPIWYHGLKQLLTMELRGTLEQARELLITSTLGEL